MELDNLKPGDHVYLIYAERIATIDRITRHGRFIIGNETYNPDGWLCGSMLDRIVPATDRHREEIEKRQIAAYLDNMNWRQVHIGQLRQIQGFLHGVAINEKEST